MPIKSTTRQRFNSFVPAICFALNGGSVCTIATAVAYCLNSQANLLKMLLEFGISRTRCSNLFCEIFLHFLFKQIFHFAAHECSISGCCPGFDAESNSEKLIERERERKKDKVEERERRRTHLGRMTDRKRKIFLQKFECLVLDCLSIQCIRLHKLCYFHHTQNIQFDPTFD